MLTTEIKPVVLAVQDAPKARRPLDNFAFNVSADRTFNRAALRNSLRTFSTVARVCTCGLALRGNTGFVHVVRDARGRVSFLNLETCRRVWLCPVCAPRIAWKRAQLLESQTDRWLKAGRSVLFQTLTFPHDYADPLSDSAKVAAKAFTAVLSGRKWQDDKDRYDVVGSVRSLEVTVGGSGWHPHIHALFYQTIPRGVRARRALQASVFGRFARVIEKAGFRPPDIRNSPLEIVSSAEVGMYIAKASGIVRELTSWHMKSGRGGNRTPFELLRDVVMTDTTEDRRLWAEWETGMHRRRQLTYSRGLKKVLDRDAPQPELSTDHQIEQMLASVTAAITPELWLRITNSPGLDLSLRKAFSTGGYPTAVAWLVDQLGPQCSAEYIHRHFVSTSFGEARDPHAIR
jgi:replication protein